MEASSFKSRRGCSSKVCLSSTRKSCKRSCFWKKPKLKSHRTKRTNKRKKSKMWPNLSTANSKIRIWIDKMKLTATEMKIINSIKLIKKLKTTRKWMPMTTLIRQISMIVIAKRDLLQSNNQMIWTSTVTTTDHYSKAKESISSTQNRALSLQSVQIVHTKRALRNLGPVKKSKLDQHINIQMCKITHSHSSSLILQPKTSMNWVRRRKIL